MRRSSWEVVPGESTAEVLVIKDIGGVMNMTVTNDAENVVIELVKANLLKRGMRLFYYDSDGTKDEILFDDRGFFRGFATLVERHPSTIYVALAKAQHSPRFQSPSLKIETTGELPDFGTVEEGWEKKSHQFFANQARDLVDALTRTLPGGTLIAMLRYMLLGHGSHWRVPMVELPIDNVEWVGAAEVQSVTVDDWWWWIENELSAAAPVFVVAHTDEDARAFASSVEWDDAREVLSMGGLWKRLPQPDLPAAFQRNPNTGVSSLEKSMLPPAPREVPS